MNCEYYLTSENAFRDFHRFEYEHTGRSNRFRFYSLSQNIIKFLLSDEDYGNRNGSSSNQFEFGKNKLINLKGEHLNEFIELWTFGDRRKYNEK